MENELSPLEASIQEQLKADTAFQEEIEFLEDEDRETAIAKKERELYKETASKLAADAEKAKEIAKNQEIRAKKAEQKAKAEPQQPKEEPVPQSGYSIQDIKVLAKIHDDDVEKVEKFAKAEGLSLSEAMKSEDLQAILKYREEIRTTAEATNTGKAKRSAGKISEEQIVASAYSGKEVDPAELAAAELALRRKKLQQ